MQFYTAFALFALTASVALANDTLSDFNARETHWVHAIKEGNKNKLAILLDELLADDFIYQHGSGKNLDKAKYTHLLMTNGITVTAMGAMEINVRDYDNVVITYGSSELEGVVFYDHPYAGRLRFVNIWKKGQDGSWKLHHRNSELLETVKR